MKLWLRLYTEVLNDPKVQKLDGNSFKFWINLLCCAKEYSNDGILPDLGGIAFHLRIKEETAHKYLEKMIESGLVENEANTYIIHGWSTRQYESDNDPTALDRKRRERDRKKSVTEMSRVTSRTCHGNVTLTEPEQIPETDTEPDSERTKSAPELPTVSGSISGINRDIFTGLLQTFLQVNGGKLPNMDVETRSIYEIMHRTENDPAEIQAIIEAYETLTKSGDKFWQSKPMLPSWIIKDGIWEQVRAKAMQKADAINRVFEASRRVQAKQAAKVGA